jgi:hypothetical protein
MKSPGATPAMFAGVLLTGGMLGGMVLRRCRAMWYEKKEQL